MKIFGPRWWGEGGGMDYILWVVWPGRKRKRCCQGSCPWHVTVYPSSSFPGHCQCPVTYSFTLKITLSRLHPSLLSTGEVVFKQISRMHDNKGMSFLVCSEKTSTSDNNTILQHNIWDWKSHCHGNVILDPQRGLILKPQATQSLTLTPSPHFLICAYWLCDSGIIQDRKYLFCSNCEELLITTI